MTDPSDWINQFTRDLDEALKQLHQIDPVITRDEAQEALTKVLGLDEPAGLLYRELPADKIISLLEEFDFSALRPEILDEVRFEETIIPNAVPCLLTEQEVKIKGQIWTIHKNDADPFPSNPHAHNYDEDMVADLSNGKLYRKRKEIGKLKKKKLLLLREAINNVELPPLDR